MARVRFATSMPNLAKEYSGEPKDDEEEEEVEEEEEEEEDSTFEELSHEEQVTILLRNTEERIRRVKSVVSLVCIDLDLQLFLRSP